MSPDFLRGERAGCDLASVVNPVVDVGRLPAAKRHDHDCMPSEVVTAGGLKPHRLAAIRAALDPRVPIEEPRAKVLVGGLRLVGRIDQATEQILFAAT